MSELRNRKAATSLSEKAEKLGQAVQEEHQKSDDSNEKETKLRDHHAQASSGKKSEHWGSALVAVTLTVLSLWTRLYKLNWADYVVWDEAHFGKFASYYIRREFYFDVHPPLGKMLLGLSGVLSMYNGSFEFESGAKYPEYVHYGSQRIFPAVCGALMVPIAYYTAVELHMSHFACILMALMVLFGLYFWPGINMLKLLIDVALLAISRFILLDSMLLLFTCLSVYCLTVFRNYQDSAPLSRKWYKWLAFTGISLGCVASVKWVGLFAIALVGLHTIEDLWEMLGDLKMKMTTYLHHWVARIVFLIIVPISVYVLSFAAHFYVLNESGTGDAQMSSLFQAGLQGNTFHENPLELAYGSRISLKNNGYGGGLLHSHIQTFPSGSEQQQVTCYHHKDTNNEWIVMKPWFANDSYTDEVEFVKNGDIVRLIHDQTRRNLHSHPNFKAPVSASEFEVSAYGNETLGDINDHWRIEIVDDLYDRSPVRIKSLTTRFLLRHLEVGCLLRSGSVTLPQWGFKQAEVACQAEPDPKSKNNMWNIEQHWHERLPPAGANSFKSSFWNDFLDLNVAMWTSNNALTPDPDKEPDALTSKPYQWPLLLVGLRMCGWGDSDIKFFLLGHPIVWWGSSGSLVLFALVSFVYAIRHQRKSQDWIDEKAWRNFYFTTKVAFVGWFLHYVPFWIMGRVTYLHHYFPALYFAIIMFTFMIDHFCGKLPTWLHRSIIVLLGLAILGLFLYFADFAFGMAGPSIEYSGRRFLNSWKIYDAPSVIEETVLQEPVIPEEI